LSAQRTGWPSGVTMSNELSRALWALSRTPVITPCTASAVSANGRRSVAAAITAPVAAA
jgi:hypothetical protein